MEKSEIIFFAIAIIAYIICALTLDIPLFMHALFLGCIIIILIFVLILKYQQEVENESVYKVLKILIIISSVFYFISVISELFYNKTLFIDSTATFMVIFVLFFGMWFFGKNKNE